MALSPQDRPALWRLARMQYDDVRKCSVLQYPEGVVMLNDTGAAILALCDGKRSLDEIVTELSTTFGADVRDDVMEYLEALVDRGLVRIEPTGAGRVP
jgi:pyrroloquinoline quinone biosynthesis protein D